MDFDPTFKIFDPNFTLSTEISLKPEIPYEHFQNDLMPEKFLDGFLTLANLDNIFNLSILDWNNIDPNFQTLNDRKFFDLSRNPLRGSSEYWLYRNRNGIVITEASLDLLAFNNGINKESFYLIDAFDSIQPSENLNKKWVEYLLNSFNGPVDLVGSVDFPTSFETFIYQLMIVVLRKPINFFLPVPDDLRITEVMELLRPSCLRLNLIRILTSPIPWLVGSFENPKSIPNKIAIDLELLLKRNSNPSKEIIFPTLKGKFFNFKKLAILWRI